MAKFRKKPIVVEAEQFNSGVKPWPSGVVNGRELPYPNYISDEVGAETRHFIETLEGYMEVTEGDWIITGVQGERYPCKPDIFEKTYEAVD